MKNSHTLTFATGLRRAIAIVLAVSMLLIPVHMPDAHAVEYENLAGTTGFMQVVRDDVTYRWNWDGNGTYAISGGKLVLSTGSPKKTATALLSGTAEDGTNVVHSWKNYTVEATVKANGNSGYKKDVPALLGGVSADGKSYYAILCYTTRCYIIKSTNGTETVLKEYNNNALNIASGDEVAMKMLFSGKTAMFYVKGTLVYTYTAAEDICGGIGLRANYNNYNQTLKAQFDDVKVTMNDFPIFEDHFDAEDATFKWTADESKAKLTEDGKLTITNQKDTLVDVVLSGTAGNVDVVNSWTNYTVEAMVNVPTHNTGRRIGPAVMGTTSNGKVYHLSCGKNGSSGIGIALWENGVFKTEVQIGNGVDLTKPVRLTLVFAGDTVTPSFGYYPTGAATMTGGRTMTAVTATAGNSPRLVGLRATPSGVASKLSSVIDSFKVTVDGVVVFNDDFSTNAAFTEAGKVMEGVYTPSDYKVVMEEAYTRWSVTITSDCNKATVTINDYDTANTVKVNGEEVALTDGVGKYEITQPGNYTVTAKDADGKEVTKNIKVGHEYNDFGHCTNCTYECPHDVLEADDGDCTTAVKCTKCGKVGFAAQTHVATGNWLSDGTNHYKECANTLADGTPCTGHADEEACSGGAANANCQNKPTCDVCGNEYINDSLHDKNEEKWFSDGTNHWRECKVEGCTEHLDEAAHTGGEANCKAGKICSVCQKEYTEKVPSNHTGTSDWVQTETTHNKKFNCCGAQDSTFVEEEHHWENGVCTECGYGCAHKGGTATCQTKATCEICGQKYGNLGDHDWKTEWSSDGTNHWHECKVEGCTETKDKTGHTPNTDDGDCTTAILCSACNAVTTAAKDAHTGGTATCKEKAECIICHKKYGEIGDHMGGTATCTEKATCSVCNQIYGEVSARNHTKEAEWIIKEDTHKQIYTCCGKVVIEESAHTVGEATCTDKAQCTVCGKTYGELNPNKHSKEEKWVIDAGKHSKAYACCGKVTMEAEPHSGGAATCTESAKCTVCGGSYGKLNADNHTKDVKWFTDFENHNKAYECCGKVVFAKEEHKWNGYDCTVCGYEMEIGSEKRPIEIKGESGTIEVEYEIDTKKTLYFELDENLAGKIITVKGLGSVVVADGASYTAPKDMVEFKLPKKFAKISLSVKNNDTEAHTYTITIAVSDDTNSETGDTAQIMLFGSLLAMSVLAGGILLMPGIRKKLLNQ